MTSSPLLLVGGGDTIAALATAQGRSATAVIRLSGARAIEIASQVTHGALPPPRVAALRTLTKNSESGEALDHCVVTVFPGPHSYTGEDTVEFSVHGGFMVPSLALEVLLLAGAREALPGEFTRRALLNGKMDLLQAEAVSDLIDSRSRGAASAALRQLDGGLTRRILELRSAILEVEALVAYDIDFPEEDDGPIDRARISSACDHVISNLAGLIATSGVGEMLREGALVVIAGAPNTGKSSLFNALIGSRRSIVTDIPGTTRDAIEAVIDADAWTLRLVDTAGLRDAADIVERIGIEVAEEYLVAAQIVVVCGDTDELLRSAISQTQKLSSAAILAVRTKSDQSARSVATSEVAGANDTTDELLASACEVSALTGAGLSDLLQRIGRTLATTHGAQEAGAPMLLRARHLRAVSEAREEMILFARALEGNALPMPVAGTHLRAAANALESLIGVVGIEDVLDRVFSSFCVGK